MDSRNSVFSCALDASAFYSGIPFLSSGRYCTTPAVFDEVKHIKKSHGATDVLLDSGSLQIVEPGNDSVERIKAAAKKTGDYSKLSQADVSVLALALQFKIALMTDDYAVANVAATLKIPVQSSSGKGIKETRKWISYCSACGKAFGPDAKECRLCGNQLKRKYKITRV